MLLTITTTHAPATDLGYLLHKHPERLQSFSMPFGEAHVFYPALSQARCSAVLLLDVDPVGLIRRGVRFPRLDQYVNDRPYVASSFMSVAIGRVFRSALAGKCAERPELVDTPLPLRAELGAIGCTGGEDILRRLFEPLRYTVHATQHPLDDAFPEWGECRYFTVALEGEVRLKDLLTHLYVLIPVLDSQKHYWVGDDEVEKLLRHGEGWLAAHPDRELIVARYVKYRRSLQDAALARLLETEQPEPDADRQAAEAEEEAVEQPMRLNEQRLGSVLAVLKASGAKSVLDLGCGSGKLLAALIKEPAFERIAGADISHRALDDAASRLKLDRLAPRQRERVSLLQTALTYRDRRLAGFDAAAVVEVIEHFDPPRLRSFARTTFGEAQPKTVVITTPNREYNAKFGGLPAGKFRHRDHRFEWTRRELEDWAGEAAGRYGYSVRFLPVGPVDDALGAPTQMAVFER
ncbi:MAG TPA: 3' terminal RNA ribose 2'-O-methyltransferase Hen1 [Solirubrobacteraceae bacterium]|jgi:3' terminal RNA ribose 2'-O-methyltransferase Hen1|nr:3' terminal RNA ribose 2'-O-methyltransferase Hen1 [Solirubrobacteraceae bacterium]